MAQSNLTSGFIDLATYDELEKYMYGGADATAYFVRETRKATWFTQVPVVLSQQSGNAQFGQQNVSWNISRAGDYLLNTWLRVNVPQVTCTQALESVAGGNNTDQALCYTRNLMHNLVSRVQISFNDLVAQQFGTQFLDFWAAFTVPASKRVGYDNMVGNVGFLTDPAVNGAAGGSTLGLTPATTAALGPAVGTVLNLPLPLFYTRDSGVALPTAALPYNDMKVSVDFRTLAQLVSVVTRDGAGNTALTPVGSANIGAPLASANMGGAVAGSRNGAVANLANVEMWSTYAIVSNQERKRMACAPRDILIEQVQTFNAQNFNVAAAGQVNNYDIRFSQAIKLLFFGVTNATSGGGTENAMSNRSNYTSRQPVAAVAGGVMTINRQNGADPVDTTTLLYENTVRLGAMGSDYFSLVCPYYTAPTIPDITGFHLYSYSLDFICLDPLGSTNYGKLTNISLRVTASADANVSSVLAQNGQILGNTFLFVASAVNNNIIRISGGALGFPVL